jgi:HK97 family phage prohead protease
MGLSIAAPILLGRHDLDFKLYTNALKAYQNDSGEMYVSGTTSSTIRDLHGDEMTTDALKSMADTAKQNMTIWLNHNYNVPEDLFGSVTDARIVKRVDETTGEEVYDLDIDIKVCPEDENPEALRTYKAIKRGVRLGLSIGARVEQASKKKDKNTGVDTYVIERIRLLESSVVGIPANQRSYLQNAVKSLRARGEEIEKINQAIEDEETIITSTRSTNIDSNTVILSEDSPNPEGVVASGDNGVGALATSEPQVQEEDKQKENVHMDTTENTAAEVAAEALPPLPPTEQPEAGAVVEIAPAEEAVVEVAAPEAEAEPVVEEEAVEKALTLSDRCGNVMAELESIAAEEADANRKQCLINASGWIKAYNEYAAPQEDPEEGETEDPNAPAPEAGEEEEDESKPFPAKDATGTADLAKIALDAANAAKAEVEALKSALTALSADKAKVDADFEKAVALLEKAAAVPVGRKSGYQPTTKTASKAVWLEPYVQRLLDSNEE